MASLFSPSLRRTPSDTPSNTSPSNSFKAGDQDKLQKLRDAQVNMRRVLDDDNKFGNECEEVFTEFRRPIVQLRNSPEALELVEDKATAVRFMCKFCKARPPYHNRCEEVLKILMLSDAWKKTFQADPEVDALPQSIAADLKPPAPAGPDVVAVVQRCSRAQILLDEERGMWQQVGRGLFVCVSFGKDASEEKVQQVGRSLLTAPLSISAPLSKSDRAGKAESIVAICKRGEEQGIVIVPQASLSSQLEAGTAEIESAKTDEDKCASLYRCLTDSLTTVSTELLGREVGACLPKIVTAGSGSGDSQSWEVSSDGMMRSFDF